eukprot:TRINITY_DN3343_c0_g1_i1.p1 TRINITY_DN3343_c0_g1~~TRINITY_DN3343_c0_g1_i1.p1  ORF type:complete len:241 (-),score=59.57 TRINITY_DN3343_c0_g1_i1:210-932(-)
MLKLLMITSSSGLLLYSKEFYNFPKPPRMYAGILTAMLEKGNYETGFNVQFIEYSNLSICFCTTKNKITCTVIYDSSDGHEFGQIVTQAVLSTFIEVYSEEFKVGSGAGGDFSSFNDKIPETFRNCVEPALYILASKRGIDNVVLISENQIFSTGETLDKVGVLGNWGALAGVTTEIMSAANDSPYLITLHNDNKRLVIRTIDKSTLVVSFKSGLNYSKLSENVEEAASLLAKILALRHL